LARNFLYHDDLLPEPQWCLVVVQPVKRRFVRFTQERQFGKTWPPAGQALI